MRQIGQGGAGVVAAQAEQVKYSLCMYVCVRMRMCVYVCVCVCVCVCMCECVLAWITPHSSRLIGVDISRISFRVQEFLYKINCEQHNV